MRVGVNFEALSDPKQARERTGRVHELLEQAAEVLVEIAKETDAMRELLGAKDFAGWMTSEFRRRLPDPARYVRAAHLFGEVKKLGIFPEGHPRGNVPQAAVDEILMRLRAKNGA